MHSIFFNSLFHRAIWIVVSIILMVPVTALLSEEPATIQEKSFRRNSPTPLNADASAVEEPHRWLADVPPAMARLVDIGNVQLRVDQPAVEAAHRTALTKFTFTLKYRMRYRISELPKNQESKSQCKISSTIFDIETDTTHRILLSEYFRPVKPWETELLQHEFDHVAISTDPRMFEMLRSLEGRKLSLIATPDQNTNVSDDWAKKAIENSISEFQRAVEQLVQRYYLQLDEVSNNGLKNIDDRSRFFTELYSLKNLERMRFPYLTDVKERIVKVKQDQIKKHYRLP